MGNFDLFVALCWLHHATVHHCVCSKWAWWSIVFVICSSIRTICTKRRNNFGICTDSTRCFVEYLIGFIFLTQRVQLQSQMFWVSRCQLRMFSRCINLGATLYRWYLAETTRVSEQRWFSFSKVWVSAVSTIRNDESLILINPLMACMSFLNSEKIWLNKSIGIEEFGLKSPIAFQFFLNTVHFTRGWKCHSKWWCCYFWFCSQFLICKFLLMMISFLEKTFFCFSLGQFNSFLRRHKSCGIKSLRRNIEVLVSALFTSEIVKGGFVGHTIVSTIMQNYVIK